MELRQMIFRHCLKRTSHRSVPILFGIIVLFVEVNAQTNSTISSSNSTLEAQRQCSNDQMCLNLIDSNLNANVVCVDSVCYCGANYRTIYDTTTSHRLTMSCVEFRCHEDPDCQQYDLHRVCNLSNGQCVCRRDYLEKPLNGRRCAQKYATLPAYVKKSRKYLNKNRISYREDIEYLSDENPKVLWIQYITFFALFISQIILIVNYVIVRRRAMIQKILKQNELLRQNGEQLIEV